MKKSIFLFFAAILCAMSANAYTVYLNTGNTDWATADAKFKVWTGSEDVEATKIGNKWYSFEVGDATGTMYFKRCDPTSGGTWNEFNASISSTNNLVLLNDWNAGESSSSLHVTGDEWGGIGSWNIENEAGKMTLEGNVFTKTFTNVSASAHQFKLTFNVDSDWSHAIGYSDNVSCVNGTVVNKDGNIQFTPLAEGTVTITYTLADGKVHITCPEPPAAEFNITYPATQTNYTLVAGPAKAQTGAEVSFTATPAEGYVLNVTYNGNVIAGENNIYTFMMPAADVTIAIEAVAATTIYYVDNNSWGNANAYMWNDSGNNGWPGVAMTSVGTVGENNYAYYSVSFAQGAYTSVIFSNNGSNQTADQTIDTAKPYFYDGAWYTWDDLLAKLAAPVVTYDYYIAGTENLTGYNWKANGLGMTKDGDLYKHTFSALPAGEYEFKITDGQWNSEGDATHEHTTLGAAYKEVTVDGNIKFVTEEAKNITVIFNAATDKITFDGLTEITEGLTYTVKTPWGTENCYIASATTGWNFRQMDPTDENRVFTITIVGAKETDEYKYACQPEWDFAEVREADENGNTNRKAWAERDTVDLWGTRTYTVAGNNAAVFGTEWDAENWDNDMTLQDDGTYVWTKPAVYLTGNVEFKVIKNQNWATAWPADNYVVDITEEAYYSLTIYYNPANNDITVVTNKLTVQTGSLTVDGVMLEEMEYDGINLLSLTGQSSDYTTGVTIFLENYTGEDKAYDVHYDSAIDWNYNYSSSVSGQLTQTTGADGIRTFTGVLDVVFEAYDEVADAMVGQPYELTVTLVEKTDEATLVVVTDATVTLEAGLTMTGEWTDEYDGTTYPVLVTVPGFDQSVASAELDASITVGGEGEDDPWLGWVEGPTTVTVEEDVVTVTGVLENVWFGVKLDVTISGTLPVVEEPEPDPDPTPDPEETPDYTRTVSKGSLGTICLPNGSDKFEGAEFYALTYKKAGYIYAVTVNTLEAGVPYVFKATSTELKVYYNTKTASAAGSANGLYGTFTDIEDGEAGTTGNQLEGKYLLVAGNKVQKCGGNCSLAANRAYFVVSEISDVEQQSAPGRKQIALGYQEENQATGVDNITENGVVAPALQGTYDILGRQLSEPAANGFYIINGKKVLVVK